MSVEVGQAMGKRGRRDRVGSGAWRLGMAKEQTASEKERGCFLAEWRLQCSMQWRDADQRQW